MGKADFSGGDEEMIRTMTKQIIAWDGNTPVYASKEGLAWQRRLASLREQWEASQQDVEREEIKSEYFAVMCAGY
jgi:hypothetical protein